MKNNILALLVVLIILFGINGKALAGRPLSTDDAGTLEPGHIEIELGWEFVKGPSDDKENSLALALTAGIIWERLDFGVEVPYLWLDPDAGDNEDGVGDLELGFKLRFLDETDNFPALAFTSGIKTETGDSDKGLGTGEVDYVGNLIATKEIGKVTIHANVGYNYTGDLAEEEDYDLVNLSLASELAVNEQFTLVGEVSLEIATEDIDEDNPVEILIGGSYEFNSSSVLDTGVSFGLTDGAADYKVTSGLTLSF